MRQREVYTRAFKLAALARFNETSNVSALARELGINREQLYAWKHLYDAGGEAALRQTGHPGPRSGELRRPTDASERIAGLERTIGRQQVELDFFRAALQQVRGLRRGNGGPGGPASTR